MEFNSNDDLRRFAKHVEEKMEYLGNSSIAYDLREWNETAFLPSELLGELRIILKRVESLAIIDSELKQQVGDCIAAINKAFGQ
ncbi:MAG: hypothetical protein ABFC57_13185 [Veillonellales bacterium]